MRTDSNNIDKPQPRPKRTKIVIVALIILCIAGSSSGIFFYTQYSQVQAKAHQKEELTDRIGALVQLPDEASTLVTVADKSRLQNKQLADKVTNGDVLMIFAQNHRLIIYRPSVNKIVDMLSFSAADTSTLQK